jgi:hypothetical protein
MMEDEFAGYVDCKRIYESPRLRLPAESLDHRQILQGEALSAALQQEHASHPPLEDRARP